MGFLKQLLGVVLPVAWIGFMVLWGLPFIHQFDLTPGWLMAIVFIALILTVMVFIPLLIRGGSSGGGSGGSGGGGGCGGGG